MNEGGQDAEGLRQALMNAQAEIEAMRKEVASVTARQDKLVRSHEEALSVERRSRDQEVIAAELRAEAIRHGAHNPEDVARLIDLTDVRRDEDGKIQGVVEAVERARKERTYLFGASAQSGAVRGTTVGRSAPRPGGGEPFDARRASGADYEARKWQFLAQG